MNRKPLSVRELMCNPVTGRRPTATAEAATGCREQKAVDFFQPPKGAETAAVRCAVPPRPAAPGPADSAVIGEVLDQSAVGLLILNAKGRVVWMNGAFARYVGLPANSLIGQDYRQVIDRRFEDIFEDCGPLRRGLFDSCAGDGESEPGDCHVLPDAARRERWLEHRSQAIRAGGLAGGRIEHFTDIGARKKTADAGRRRSDRLLRDQKLEAIGTLAGGVAHDFNNLLQAISGYTQLLMINKPAGDPDTDMLVAIDKATARATALTQQLLAFSRRTESRLQPADLNTLIGLVKGILERTLPQMIRIHLTLDDNLPEVSLDDAQIEQVLMNLALNARQAMPGGGTLTFATRRVRVDDADGAAGCVLAAGEYVRLSVIDTGSGMDDDTRQHIFEPFYTTRDVGEGSGLGLSMVHGILKNHGAGIECTSEADGGTRFSIYFPVSTAVRRPAARPRDDQDDLWGGGETVLIVDDDPALLTLNKNVLELHGYRALTAESGEAALRLCASGEGIDLVVLDVTMPGMGGEKCLFELARQKPELKIIVTSGHPPDESLHEMLAAAGGHFVGKPYPLESLLAVMRRMLNRRTPAAQVSGPVPHTA